jgi:hypothetical protein
MYFRLWVLIVGLLFGSAGCAEKIRGEHVTHVKRIFMQDPKRFTLLVQDVHTRKMQIREMPFFEYCGLYATTFVPDVSVGDDLWVMVVEKRSGGVSRCTAEMHIHSEGDLEGGGWNHGKRGHGQTTVLE